MYPGAFHDDDDKDVYSYDGGHGSGFIIDVIKAEKSSFKDEDFLVIIQTSRTISVDWGKAINET
eukprot:12394065-Prorocentrum_lima.AAC.1